MWVGALSLCMVKLNPRVDHYMQLLFCETATAMREGAMLRTDKNGRIALSTDGDEMLVEVMEIKQG